MTDKLIVLVTCDGREQAETIAQAIVTEKLAACVNVMPGVRSCYVWESKLTWSEEALLLIKTTKGRYSQLQESVRRLHSSQIPEIVSLEIEDGFEKYIDWISASVGG